VPLCHRALATEKGLLHFAALGPWLYLDIFRRETEQTFFSHTIFTPTFS
jgi:hypothetical protein